MKRTIISVTVALGLLISCIAFPAAAKEANYPYMKDGKIDMLGYFDVKGATNALKTDSVDFTLTEQTATITFKKSLAADIFSLHWNGVDDSKKLLESLSVVMTDTKDSNSSLKVTFSKVNDINTAVTLSGEGKTYLIPASTYKVNQTDMELAYDAATKSLSDGNSDTFYPAKSQNGNDFEGFQSHSLTVTIEVTGKVGATFSLKELNTQRFGSDYQTDNVEPDICIPFSLTKALYNSVVTLPTAMAADVLADNATLKMTVKTPSGKIATDKAGTSLKDVDGNASHKLKVNEYGLYRVSYAASDGTNQTRDIGYTISVTDMGAPAVQLASEFPQKITVGTEVKFPKMKITDNAKGNCATWINVKHPSGIITHETTGFKPEEKGKYTIIFSAVDSSGNIGSLTMETNAEGGK